MRRRQGFRRECGAERFLLDVEVQVTGVGPLIVNLASWRAHFLERLARQIAVTGDDSLRPLMEEVAAYLKRVVLTEKLVMYMKAY